MTKYGKKSKSKHTFIGVLVLLLVYQFVVTQLINYSHKHRINSVFNKQVAIFTPLINDLVGQSSKETVSQCDEDSHTHFKSNVYCDSFQNYNWQFANDTSSQKVKISAKALDNALIQNGWSADRPQDSTKTIYDLVNSDVKKLDSSTTGFSVPFHKNIGSISCNLDITISLAQDNKSISAINLNTFTCSQSFSYPRLHFDTVVSKGP